MKSILIATLLFATSSALAILPSATPAPMATPRATADEVKRKTQDAVGATADYAKESKEAFEVRMQKNLNETERAIRDLKAKAKKSAGETKTQMNAGVRDLEVKRDQMKSKLAEVGASSSNAWHDLASGVTRAWKDVKKSTNKAADEFHTQDKVTDQ